MSTSVNERPVMTSVRTAHRSMPAPQPDATANTVRPPRAAARRGLIAVAAMAMIGVGGWQAYARMGQWHGASAAESIEGDAVQHARKATLGFVPGGEPARETAGTASRLETVPVEIVQQNATLRLTGTLVADEKAKVASNVSGILAEVRVDRGSVVRKNDVLAQLDPVDAQNRLAEGRALVEELKARLGFQQDDDSFDVENQPEVRLAKASLDLATANLKRTEELFAKKVISAEAIDQGRTESELALQRYRQTLHQMRQTYQSYRTALAKLAILEKAVADTTIRAPFDGWVAEKLLTVGEQVTAGFMNTALVTLVRVDPLRLSLTVPQQDIGHIRQGQTVRFQVDAFPGQTFTATVQYITPVVTNDTRSMVVEAVVPNPDGQLRPGLFATAQLELSDRKPEIYAPRTAVQKTGEVARVFVVRNGTAREQVVSLGAVKEDRIEIQSGLGGDERLVARPELVRDGDAIRQ